MHDGENGTAYKQGEGRRGTSPGAPLLKVLAV